MSLKPFEEIAPEPLVFPVNGKLYTIPPVGYLMGIRLSGILAGTDHTMDETDTDAFWEFVLGDVWAQMKADNAPMEAMSRVGFATLTDFQLGREAAEKVWESGIPPEALAAAMAASQVTGQQTPPNMVAAPKTQSRASSSGTSSRRTSTRKAAAKPKASRS
jgi:hypothetical protein